MARTGVTTLQGTVAVSAPSFDDVGTIGVLPTVTASPSLSLNVEDAFRSFTDPEGNRLLSDDQIRQLTQLKLANGNPFFSVSTQEDRSYLFSLVGDLNSYGFDSVYSDLTSGKDEKPFSTRKDYYFYASPSMQGARHKARLDSEIYRDKVEVSEGAFQCRKCGSRETIAVEKQLRAADEPATIFVTCVQCNNAWRA